MRHETIEHATRFLRPKIKSKAFFLWVQHVETLELIRNAQRYGEEKGMKNMYAFIDDGRELVC
jgi:hypothetical protein